MHHRYGGLTFATAAVVFWNTIYFDQAVAELRSEGETVPDDMLGYRPPLRWPHIDLAGDYVGQTPLPNRTRDVSDMTHAA